MGFDALGGIGVPYRDTKSLVGGRGEKKHIYSQWIKK